MAFGMINWNEALRKKQELQQQQANADSSRARTARMAAESQATLTPSQIAQNEATAAVNRARAAGMPELTAAEIRASDASAGVNLANMLDIRTTTAQRGLEGTPEVRAAAAAMNGDTTNLERTFGTGGPSQRTAGVREIGQPLMLSPRQIRSGGFLSRIEEGLDGSTVTVRRGMM